MTCTQQKLMISFDLIKPKSLLYLQTYPRVCFLVIVKLYYRLSPVYSRLGHISIHYMHCMPEAILQVYNVTKGSPWKFIDFKNMKSILMNITAI